MGRKKKIAKDDPTASRQGSARRGDKHKEKIDELDLDELAEETKPRFDMASDAKRSAAAIILFAFALILLLSFFEASGVVGSYLNAVTGVVIGWAKWILPFFLVAAGVVLLLRKQMSFYVTKLLGLTITFISLISIFHWSYGETMGQAAQAGQGGGYIGYAFIYVLQSALGRAGSLVMIIAFLFIGIIVAFNFSFQKMVRTLRGQPEPDLLAEEELDSELLEEGDPMPGALPLSDASDMEPLSQTEETPSPQDLEAADIKNNIKKIQFVEGPDQYVSSSLKNKNTSADLAEQEARPRRNSRNGLGGRGKKNQSHWVLPGLDLLESKSEKANAGDTTKYAEIIQQTLKTFGIEVERAGETIGPAVTQYSFRPAVGVKIAKILALQNDLSLALAKHPIRIEAPIPGKSLIGIEVPNNDSATVRLRNILESEEFRKRTSSLMIALGEDVSGKYVFGDLTKMPHLMIAGSTGTGKSVCVNSVITTLLYQNTPDELKLILVDPKRVELSQYSGIPHLGAEVIVDNGKVVNALKWAVGEMERRYRLLQDAGSRDIGSYQQKIDRGEKLRYVDPDTKESEERDLEKLPYIVIIIDELADLMSSHGKEVEGAIVRLAQMARAVGIHLIVSTQRPSVEVITGLIKANIATRIAFRVATQIDSRTIIDMGGSEKLLGKGDLLYLSAASPKPKRVQGVFVSESEVKRVVKFFREQKERKQKEEIAAGQGEGIGEDILGSSSASQPDLPSIMEFSDTSNDSPGDDLLEAAKQEVTRAKKASASFLQRRLRVGYARAARLIDLLEEQGVVGPADGAKPREVYMAGEAGPAVGEVAYVDPSADQEKRDKWQI